MERYDEDTRPVSAIEMITAPNADGTMPSLAVMNARRASLTPEAEAEVAKGQRMIAALIDISFLMPE